MRELKFRAWDKKSKQYLAYGFSVLGEVTCFDLIGMKIKEVTPKDTILERLNDIVLEQFTGLKDKNGVDIYEGDIIRIKHPYKNRTYTGEIIYTGAGFNGVEFYFPHHDNPSDVWESLSYLEVIGNIHENPELLND